MYEKTAFKNAGIYTCSIRNEPGHPNLSNILPRSPLPHKNMSSDTDHYANWISNNTVPFTMSLDEIRRETASDKTVYVKCSLVKQMTQKSNKWHKF